MATSVEMPLLLTVKRAAAYVGIGQKAMYELVRSGEIPSIQHGVRRLVPRRSLDEWVERRTRTEATG